VAGGGLGDPQRQHAPQPSYTGTCVVTNWLVDHIDELSSASQGWSIGVAMLRR